MSSATSKLEILKKEAKTLSPGQYRVLLSPTAIQEVLSLLSWGGFGKMSYENRESPLNALMNGDQKLSPMFSLMENTSSGLAPSFQREGYVKPNQLSLIEKGEFKNHLISPRSAREFSVTCNGAGSGESPSSLDMAGGEHTKEELLKKLGTGLYIGNLWYLNYSDRNQCRMTGMTRFATFWVENGEIKHPVNVMRFDDTVYNILGKNLEALSSDREYLVDAETYGMRSTSSARLPFALVKDFTFTL